MDSRQELQTVEAHKKWDVFLSHAHEDKESIARPLAHLLTEHGARVWFDEFELRIGDSLAGAISEGLRRSTFGLVLISPAFLRKEWPKKELAALFSLESQQSERVLPVWHEVSKDVVGEFSSLLLDRVALDTRIGIKHLAEAILKRIGLVDLDGPLEDVAGLWRGLSGRLRLARYGDEIIGEYDWFGRMWVGEIKGRISKDVIVYDWGEEFMGEQGPGFFLHRQVVAGLGGSAALIGGWLDNYHRAMLEAVVEDYRVRLADIPLVPEFTYGVWSPFPHDGYLRDGKFSFLHPWIFRRRRRSNALASGET